MVCVGDLEKTEMTNSSISTNAFSIGGGYGFANDPKSYIQRIEEDKKLMRKLAEIDEELYRVVTEKDTSALQELLKRRNNVCHCRFVSELNHFLGHIRQTEVINSLKKKWVNSLCRSRHYFFDDMVAKIYIMVEVNGHNIEAYLCSGSCSSVISKSKAAFLSQDGLLKRESERATFDIKIGKTPYTCQFLIQDSDVDFSFGFDILSRLKCIVDLEKEVLKVGNEEITIHLFKDNPLEESFKEVSISQGVGDSRPNTRALRAQMRALSLQSENGSAKQPESFIRYIRKDGELMAKLFKIPMLVEAVEGGDPIELQCFLKRIHCVCTHCIYVFAHQHLKEHGKAVSYMENDYNIGGSETLVMPYVKMTVGFGLKCEALVDTGAQSTIMSSSLAGECGLLPFVKKCYESCRDHRKILGPTRFSFIKINKRFFPCPASVVDSTNIKFVLGLDMLCKLKCILDFKDNILRVGDDEEASQPFFIRQEDKDDISEPSKRQRMMMEINEEDAHEAKILVMTHGSTTTRADAETALEKANWSLKTSFGELSKLYASRIRMVEVEVNPFLDSDDDDDDDDEDEDQDL